MVDNIEGTKLLVKKLKTIYKTDFNRMNPFYTTPFLIFFSVPDMRMKATS